MLLWIATAAAADSSAALEDWDGAAVAEDLLTLADGSMVFAPGEMASFSLRAHVRLADGAGFTLQAGDAALTLNYTATGGITLGDTTVPFPVDELGWDVDSSALLTAASTWETGGVSEPEILAFGDDFFLYYTGGPGDETSGIGVATSPDLSSWIRYGDPLLTGTGPTAVVDGDTVVLYYGCDGAICRATSPDGLAFTEAGVVIADGSAPSVVRDDVGTWYAWYTRADGTPAYATSADGVTWEEDGAVDDRLVGVDAWFGTYGFDGVYSVGDGLGWARGGDDPTFASSGTDLVPVVGGSAASWSDDGVGDASIVADGPTLHLYYAGQSGEPVIGHAVAAPVPGSWAGLVLTWDGTTCTASWNDGPALTVPLAAAASFTLTVDGTFEMDEVLVDWTTPETGETGDTAGDTAPDTGETGDTAGDTAPDTAIDTAGDTAADLPTAAEVYGEPGGFGCVTTGPVSSGPLSGDTVPLWLGLGGLAALGRRRR